MSLIWFLLPLMTLTIYSFGDLNVNIVYLLSFFLLFKKRDIFLPKETNIFIFLLIIFLIKFSLSGCFDLSLLVKIVMPLIFFTALYNHREKIENGYKAYFAAMYICLAYAFYQYAVIMASYLFGLDLDPHSVLAILPVEIWNVNYWHIFLTTSSLFMGTFLLRVPSFALEPAYFNIFLAMALFILLVFRKEPPRRIIICLFLLGFFLTFSRNGLSFLIVFALLGLVYRKLSRPMLIILLFISYFTPLVMSLYLDVSAYDASFFVRFFMIKAFFTSEAQTAGQFMLGVNNIREFMLGTKDFNLFASNPLFSAEVPNMLKDAKSFIADLLYNFGLVGLFGFFALHAFNFHKSRRCLMLLIVFNFVIFNVNILAWPVYWAFYLSLILLERQERASEYTREDPSAG